MKLSALIWFGATLAGPAISAAALAARASIKTPLLPARVPMGEGALEPSAQESKIHSGCADEATDIAIVLCPGADRGLSGCKGLICEQGQAGTLHRTVNH